MTLFINLKKNLKKIIPNKIINLYNKFYSYKTNKVIKNFSNKDKFNYIYKKALWGKNLKSPDSDFFSGDSFSLKNGINIQTTSLNHPKGATGYRVNYKGFSVCYITDTEHIVGKRDENILQLIDNSDLVIYDSTYTDEEYPNFVGWGHSTWQEGVRLCTEANVKKFAIFHHDPDHNDEIMTKIKMDAKKLWDGTFVATEGVEINLKYDLGGSRILEFGRFNSVC